MNGATASSGLFETYLGVQSDYVIIGLVVLVLILIVLMLVNGAKQKKMKKAYEAFMEGSDGASLEDTLIRRIEQIDSLVEANATNERNIDALYRRNRKNYCRFGLYKYDALQELGGKMSFALCLLDENSTGFILNAVHSREGCYIYVKEIIDGNSVIALAGEEEEALAIALKES